MDLEKRVVLLENEVEDLRRKLHALSDAVFHNDPDCADDAKRAFWGSGWEA